MNPKKGNVAIIALVLLALLAGGYYFLSRDGTEGADSASGIVEQGSGVNDGAVGAGTGDPMNDGAVGAGTGDPMMNKGDGAVMEGRQTVTVTFTKDGYSPKEVTIKKGDTVIFVNEDSKETWPASAVHPTHSVYPIKTESDCLGSAFDACRGLKTGESWSFTFTEIGTWRYHDHLNASKTGSVIVTE